MSILARGTTMSGAENAPHEQTLDDLLRVAGKGDLAALSRDAHVSLATLLKLRSGIGVAQEATLARVGEVLGVPAERVRDAVRASRRARGRYGMACRVDGGRGSASGP